MNMMKLLTLALAAVILLPEAVTARESSRNFEIHNRLRLEYDDNIRDSGRDKTASFKIIEEIEFLANLSFENTFASVRYKPSFVWWENRDGDSTDLHHDLDLSLSHAFTPRTRFSVKDTLRYAELPEVSEQGVVTRRNSDYLYNSLNSTLSYLVTPTTVLNTSGSYNLLRYDESDVAQRDDYDSYVAGLTLRHNLVPETTVSLDARYSMMDYRTSSDRDSDVYQLGAGAEHMFSPVLLANARLGYQYKDFGSNEISSESSPFVDASLTFVPAPSTRFTVGAGYSQTDSDIFPYANQEQTSLFLGASHDFTARISLNLVASYLHGKYRASEAVRRDEDIDLGDGSEDIIQLSARATYRIDRNNQVEAGWHHTSVDSDLREDYDRNRFSIGWRTKL